MGRTVLLSIIAAVILNVLLLSSSVAESISLPGQLQRLENEAFSGCESFSEVYLPSAMEAVDPAAFDGAGTTLWIHGTQGAVARELMMAGLDIDADTVCRALLIGQSYAGTSLALQGPANDTRAMRFCLSSLERQAYQIIQRTNLSAVEIKEAISSAFGSATEYDISLFFYSGHGHEDGSLVGGDQSLLSPQELRSALDAIPGRKAVIIDSCFSGAFLEGEAAAEGSASNQIASPLRSAAGSASTDCISDLSSFNAAFLSAFSNVRKRGMSADDYSQYYVMTSARMDEYSEEGLIYSGSSSRIMGFFSYFLCKGCGWDGVLNNRTEQYADTDGNGVVSFAEAFSYAAAQAKNYNDMQDAQSNMEDCHSFSPFR